MTQNSKPRSRDDKFKTYKLASEHPVLGSSTHFCKFLSILLTRFVPNRSYFFYYRISRNGKKHPFMVEIFFCYLHTHHKWQEGVSNGKKFSTPNGKTISYFQMDIFAILIFAIMEEIASAVFEKCYWHFRWKDRKLNPANVVDHKFSGPYWVL